MPGDPQSEAEGIQRAEWRSGWHPGPRSWPGEVRQADVHGDRVSTVLSSDAVDGKQTQQCGGAQTARGVS